MLLQDGSITAYTSFKDQKNQLAPTTLDISANPKTDRPTLTVDTDTKFQTITGFGGAFTDAVAHNFGLLKPKLQEEVIEALWGKTGQQYNMARLTIGSTDFATRVYNYNEPTGVPLSTPDLAQTNFSVAPDEAQIIPMIKSALAKNSELEFVSTSWSPPGWMKRKWFAAKGFMRNSAKPGMIWDPAIFDSYALYLSKYLSAYKAHGIDVKRMTIQNEPDSADHQFPVAYPCNNFNGTGEGLFLKNHLGPRIRKDHPDVKIYVHDGQKFHDVPILTRFEAIKAAAGGDLTYIDGVAFHWYGNNLANYQYLAALHAKYPSLPLLATEATLKDPRTQLSPWTEAQKYAVDILGDLNNGAEGWIEWNVLLDTTGGPTCIGPTGDSYCTPLVGHCDAPILADTKKQTLEYRDTYWFMAHFSRFLPRGSVRVAVSHNGKNTTKGGLQYTAAVTPADDLVVVVLNPDNSDSAKFQLQVGKGQYVVAPKLPQNGIQTIVVPLGKVRAQALRDGEGGQPAAAPVAKVEDVFAGEQTWCPNIIGHKCRYCSADGPAHCCSQCCLKLASGKCTCHQCQG